MTAYSNNYLANQIAAASPEKLLIMFYDGAIRFLNQAKKAIAEKNVEKRNYSINKATAIIMELAATLDHDIGGKIAEDLDALYFYMIKELNKATAGNTSKPIDIVLDLLTGLRQTWHEAIELVKHPTGGSTSAAPKNESKEHKPLSVSL
ncbi:MAG: flagellar export chaperone FliS [Desulfobulbaceae bacterium]|nr:flagellar export chaperone FliS [Desulfobulbaceae bacterium]